MSTVIVRNDIVGDPPDEPTTCLVGEDDAVGFTVRRRVFPVGEPTELGRSDLTESLFITCGRGTVADPDTGEVRRIERGTVVAVTGQRCEVRADEEINAVWVVKARGR